MTQQGPDDDASPSTTRPRRVETEAGADASAPRTQVNTLQLEIAHPQVLDLGVEAAGTERVPETIPYSPDRHRELMRGLIAGGLFCLIAAMSIGTVALLAFKQGFGVDEAAKLFGAIVSPVIALSSGVLGFYFGSSQRR